MIIQVHDELIFSVLEDHVEQLVEMASDVMENCYPLSVPTPVEAEVGPSWGEVEPIEKWRETVMA